MSAATLLADLAAKPAALARLASHLAQPGLLDAIPARPERIVLLGMGSSRYASIVSAPRLRAAGLFAVEEVASAEVGTPAGPGTLVLAISANGGSVETLAALERHRGRSRVVAITNRPGSPVTEGVDAVIELAAGEEVSGVACRTFQHTLLLLRAIEARLTGVPADVAGLAARVGAATEHLLAREDDWRPAVSAALDGPDGVAVLAPAERWSSALQSALMYRECPRRPGVGSETGDWAHVDVYLAKSLDYRALLLAGSRWDAQALDWLRRRGSTVAVVGADVPDAAACVRYPGDDDPAVAAGTETLVSELVAARWQAAQEADATEPA